MPPAAPALIFGPEAALGRAAALDDLVGSAAAAEARSGIPQQLIDNPSGFHPPSTVDPPTASVEWRRMIVEMMADMTDEEHRAPGDVWKTPEGKPWVVCGVDVDESGEELLQLLSMPECGFIKYTLATESYIARHGLSPEPRVKVDGSQATSLWQAVVKLGDSRSPVDLPSWTSTAEPLARDDARFNAVRSLVSSRSYSASEPRTPIIMRPAAVGGGHHGERLVGYGLRHPARSRCRREQK